MTNKLKTVSAAMKVSAVTYACVGTVEESMRPSARWTIHTHTGPRVTMYKPH